MRKGIPAPGGSILEPKTNLVASKPLCLTDSKSSTAVSDRQMIKMRLMRFQLFSGRVGPFKPLPGPSRNQPGSGWLPLHDTAGGLTKTIGF